MVTLVFLEHLIFFDRFQSLSYGKLSNKTVCYVKFLLKIQMCFLKQNEVGLM